MILSIVQCVFHPSPGVATPGLNGVARSIRICARVRRDDRLRPSFPLQQVSLWSGNSRHGRRPGSDPLAINRVPLRYTYGISPVRWKTTLLTALAFTLVISLLVVMLAFVNGMRRLTDGTGLPNNVLVLSDGATDESFSNLSASDLAEIESLRRSSNDAQTGLPLTSRETYLIVTQPLPNAKGPVHRRFLQVRGIENPALAAKVHGVDLQPEGKWFSTAGVQEVSAGEAPAIQAVLGDGVGPGTRGRSHPGAARRRAQSRPIGSGRYVPHRPAFVDRHRAFGLVRLDVQLRSLGQAIADRPLIRQRATSPRYWSAARTPKPRANSRSSSPTTTRRSPSTPRSNATTTRACRKRTSSSRWAIGFVTLVMAVGGAFGVANTMFAAISQRTKDIGVLRLLGYARWQILVSFLLESLAIGLVGGLVGCLLGSLSDGLDRVEHGDGAIRRRKTGRDGAYGQRLGLGGVHLSDVTYERDRRPGARAVCHDETPAGSLAIERGQGPSTRRCRSVVVPWPWSQVAVPGGKETSLGPGAERGAMMEETALQPESPP